MMLAFKLLLPMAERIRPAEMFHHVPRPQWTPQRIQILVLQMNPIRIPTADPSTPRRVKFVSNIFLESPLRPSKAARTTCDRGPDDYDRLSL